MRTRLRVLLPLIMGGISAPLVFWDIYNAGVIYSVGMGWDTGAPVWPYRTPEILLWFLNFPAHAVGQPLAYLMNLVAPKQHLLLFPCTLLWWWLVGLMIDRESTRPRRNQNWLVIAALVTLSGIFSALAAYFLVDAFRWWFDYGNGFWTASILQMLRFLTPAIWFVAFAALTAIRAKSELNSRRGTEI